MFQILESWFWREDETNTNWVASKVPKWPNLCWRYQKLRTSVDEQNLQKCTSSKNGTCQTSDKFMPCLPSEQHFHTLQDLPERPQWQLEFISKIIKWWNWFIGTEIKQQLLQWMSKVSSYQKRQDMFTHMWWMWSLFFLAIMEFMNLFHKVKL